MWENNGVACGGAGESDFVNNEKGFILKDNRDDPKWDRFHDFVAVAWFAGAMNYSAWENSRRTTTQRHYPELGSDTYISLEFLLSFLKRHYTGKPVVTFLNVGCFLRLRFFTLR